MFNSTENIPSQTLSNCHHNQRHLELDNYKKRLNSGNSVEYDQSKKFKFEPPLYLQRYDYLCDLLKRLECRTWLDVGCSDCRLIMRVKNFDQNLNLIVGLDIDEELLESSKERFANQLFDFLQPRERPLDLYLMSGDVAQLDPYFLSQVWREIPVRVEKIVQIVYVFLFLL